MTSGYAEDLYRALGLAKDASAKEIRAAFLRLAKEHHPDQGGDADTFRLIERAYRVLSDGAQRTAYDASYVDGAALLSEVNAILNEYVVFPSEAAAVAVTLYAAATHTVSRLEYAARLVIKSPVKRCGKSRLLDVLGQLVADPLMTADISAAGLVHSIDPIDPPTVILDEADATFGRALRGDDKAEHLRGLLNGGFTRDRTYRRYNAGTRQVEDWPTFAMAILAGIGNLPDTIEDRAVIVVMRRRAGHEKIARFRMRRDKPRVRVVGQRLGEWALARARLIGDAEPDMPETLNDRAMDAWESLVAVADVAGGDWPRLARTAAMTLAGDAEEDSLAVRLLADVRRVFGEANRLSTDDLLDALHRIEESPWADLRGKPIDAHGLANYLRTFGIGPARGMRIDGRLVRGRERADFRDAWDRYLPREGERNRRNSVTPQVSAPPNSPVTEAPVTGEGGKASDQGCYGVTDVTGTPRGTGHPTPGAVLDQIIALHKTGMEGAKIASKLSVSPATVSRTITARCQDHLHGRQPEGGTGA